MRRVLIMGAAGRDFHNFNLVFKENPEYEVVGFTAAQIPNIADRRYPRELSGPRYPEGIPIYPEERLEELIRKERVDLVVFAYSDVSFEYVMERASRALAAGADYLLLGPNSTSLKSKIPVIGVGAVRTGAGKSQTTRRVCEILRGFGVNFCVVRHPMAYGDLVRQRVQRFERLEDLDLYDCTIEEREEHEPHLLRGTTVFAGVDYKEILSEAERDFELLVWEGGNNDLPFYKPDLFILVADPLRVGHEINHYPGAVGLLSCQVVVINKLDSAPPEAVELLKKHISRYAPHARVVEARSPVSVSDEGLIQGRRVLVVEDGPTHTHGGMEVGAGVVAAERFGAKELVDPRPYAVGSLKEVYNLYPQIGRVLPALGYGEEQMRELEATINRAECDTVIIATPVDLTRILRLKPPAVRVRYELQEIGTPNLREVIEEFLTARR